MRSLQVLSICALLIALLNMPYGYYQLLRVGIFMATGILAYQAFSEERSKMGLALVATALVYNPISPLALGKELWVFVNLATIGLLISTFFVNSPERSSTESAD